MKKRTKRRLVVLESLGLGIFYLGMLAFFLYPVVDAAGYVA